MFILFFSKKQIPIIRKTATQYNLLTTNCYSCGSPAEEARQPIEMIESYYNGITTCSGVNDIRLKNGRIALVENNRKSFFLSLNTSKAISYLNLSDRKIFMPVIPFQLNKGRLKKQYKLRWVTDSYDAHLYQIEFTPRKNDHLSFKRLGVD
jgi:hypothetical protein